MIFDITNPAEVIWAIATRCYVRDGVDLVKGVWASVCEPAIRRKSARRTATVPIAC